VLQKYRLNGAIPTYICKQGNMDKDDLHTKDKKVSNENSDLINKLYSNNNIPKTHNSKTECSGMTKIKGDGESEKYIKEMHDLADKNEFKNNLIVLGLGIVIVSIILFSIIMNTSIMNPKAPVTTDKIVSKDTIDSSINPLVTPNKIYEYLNVESNRTTVLNKAVDLNAGSKNGITIYLLSEILRSNSIDIPAGTSTVKQLVEDLTSMDWKKNTDFTKLEKGDICFTTDMPDKPGEPSHAYVFMGWIEDGQTDYANICDGQVQEYNSTLHKRNISIEINQKDKFSFFLRK
jgi:hypothetical protein